MNKKELLANLESIGMRPGRGLGQNFLLDDNMLAAIVRDAKIEKGETVLEVGPGFGALSRKLLEAQAELYAVEFDHRLAEFLRKNITDPHFHLTEDDACRVDYAKLLPENIPYRAIANLPYSISSIFIVRMLETPNQPKEMYFMLQKEMADRLCAKPGSKDYGALSVRCQLCYKAQLLRTVPPDVFFPPPKVESAIAGFVLREDRPGREEFRKISGVVKTVFLQRRKQLGKVLSGNFPKEKVMAALEQCGIAPEQRPDKLELDDFRRLTAALYA